MVGWGIWPPEPLDPCATVDLGSFREPKSLGAGTSAHTTLKAEASGIKSADFK